MDRPSSDRTTGSSPRPNLGTPSAGSRVPAARARPARARASRARSPRRTTHSGTTAAWSGRPGAHKARPHAAHVRPPTDSRPRPPRRHRARAALRPRTHARIRRRALGSRGRSATADTRRHQRSTSHACTARSPTGRHVTKGHDRARSSSRRKRAAAARSQGYERTSCSTGMHRRRERRQYRRCDHTLYSPASSRRRSPQLALLTPMADVSAQPAPPSPVTFLVQGKGWGHGRGMGQWGARRRAQGWTSSQILDHYYGGTTMGTVDPNGELRVRLLREDDVDVIVVSEHNALTTSVVPGASPRSRPTTTRRHLPRPVGPDALAHGRRSPPHPRSTSVAIRHRSRRLTQRRCSRCARPAARCATTEEASSPSASERRITRVNVVPLDTYVRGVVPRRSRRPGVTKARERLPGVEGASGRAAVCAAEGSLLRRDVRRIAVPGVQRRRRSQPGRCAVVARGPADRSCRHRDFRTGAPRQQRRGCPH